MKIRSQVGMVLNLDKCIGCHTCSVTCKNVWTSREGVEYAWFNNVETKPGQGFPTDWENQEKYKGGWIRKINGKLQPRMGNRAMLLGKIFANPHLPGIDDYYEPFDFDYQNLHTAPEGSKSQPIARPRSLITGERMAKIEKGPNWEDDLGGEFDKLAKDKNFDNIQKAMYSQFENTFMMYLPRLCEHCLNPACVATCPSGAIYKREEDGIVLIDQDKCRGWRMCITGCPYKKIYFNWKSGKSEKCIFCYPRIEAGQPTVCSETCVGRIRYLGVLLYDADAIERAASTENEKDLYQRQLDVFLDPNDPQVIEQAIKDGIPLSVIEAAQQSPVYKMAMEWKLALPLHPEYRTLPMVWYVPPLSPIQSAADAGELGSNGILPDVESLRIPVQYLANLLTAGDTKPVLRALKRMLAMRHYKRAETVDGKVDTRALEEVGLTEAQAQEMYRYLAIANYEDRFVVPSSHRELAREAFPEKNGCGFTFGDGCHGSDTKFNLFNSRRIDAIDVTSVIVSRLLEYPDAALWQHQQEMFEAIAASKNLSKEDAHALGIFLRDLTAMDPLDAQAQYSELFDRGRATSLLLFEHVHGESRDRGQAMVDLLAQYEQHGLQLNSRELPDHLPLYLEYLSQLPQSEAVEGLKDIAPILALLSARLQQRESRYAVMFDLLLKLANTAIDSDKVAEKIADEARDDTPQALDAVWEEEQVKFFADKGCGDSAITAHQRRFAGAVAPQYLNITTGGQH